MRLKDPNIYGLILWGTKRGMKLFFDDNIDWQNSQPDQDLTDIRALFKYARTGLSFYCIEHRESYSAFVIYRTILDAVGRPGGFYAFMLTVPTNKIFVNNNVHSLLTSLSDLYWKRYIATALRPGQIDEHTVEDFNLFSDIIRQPEYALTAAENPARVTGADQCVVTYGKPEELQTLFQHFRREELMGYQRVFLLPGGESDLNHSLRVVELPPPPERFNITVFIRDDRENRPAKDVVVAYYRNGIAIEQGRQVTGGEFALKGGVLKTDRVQLSISGDGYLPESIREDYLFRNFEETAPVTGRVLVRMTAKPQPPPVVTREPLEQQEMRMHEERRKKIAEHNEEWERTHPKREENGFPLFVRKNRKYLLVGFAFFAVIVAGMWILLGSPNPNQASANRKDSGHHRTDSAPVVPADKYDFDTDSVLLVETLGNYRDSYDPGSEDDDYNQAHATFAGIEIKLRTQKESKQYKRYMQFFSKEEADLENIRKGRTGQPVDTVAHEKTQEEIDQYLLTILDKGLDKKANLKTKERITKQAITNGVKKSKNPLIKQKWEELNVQIEALKAPVKT